MEDIEWMTIIFGLIMIALIAIIFIADSQKEELCKDYNMEYNYAGKCLEKQLDGKVISYNIENSNDMGYKLNKYPSTEN